MSWIHLPEPQILCLQNGHDNPVMWDKVLGLEGIGEGLCAEGLFSGAFSTPWPGILDSAGGT